MTIHDDLISLYAYTRWADGRMIEAVRQLTPEQYVQEVVPGWASVRNTLLHMAGAMSGWSGALRGENTFRRMSEDELPTLADAERLLTAAHDAMDALIAVQTPETLASVWETHDPRGNFRRMPFWAAYRHIANHATYHRGQVAAKLKRLGIEPPVTDFLWWALENTPQQKA